jgi:hypothetical protein
MKLSKENIYKLIDQTTIMEKYFPSIVTIGQRYCNPFRVDRNKGCYFAWTKNNNFVFFDNAFPNYGGDCIKVCMMQYNINFREALEKINSDFGLGLSSLNYNKGLTPKREQLNKLSKPKKKKRLNLKKTHFKVFVRSWLPIDIDYWNRFGISTDLLERYEIYPVDKTQKKQWDHSYFSTTYNFASNPKDPCYAFTFTNELGHKSVKLYRPLTKDKRFKWTSNVTKDNIQGLKQLPPEGELLIITSSMKDLLTLSALGYNAIAPQGEGMKMDKTLVEMLKTRFKEIVIIYDRDEAGIKFSQEHSKAYDFKYSILPCIDDDLKDFAEYREYTSTEEFKEIIEATLMEADYI